MASRDNNVDSAIVIMTFVGEEQVHHCTVLINQDYYSFAYARYYSVRM